LAKASKPYNETTLELIADVDNIPQLTEDNVAEFYRSARKLFPDPQLTCLSFGGGQDSWAILLKIIHDPEFKKEYAPNDLVVIMSDTGNEHPYTYKAVREAEKLCKKHDIPFFFLKAGDFYHTPAWPNLKHNMIKNKIVLSAWGKKSCTASLKIAPVNKKLTDYMVDLYGIPLGDETLDLFPEMAKPDPKSASKKAWERYALRFNTKVRVIIGFAKGEEGRALNVLDLPEGLAEWQKKHVQYCYPLIEQEWDRQDAQKIILKHYKYLIPPSNCMLCFFQSDVELVWLERNHPEEFAEWVQIERAKLDRFEGEAKNHGVYEGWTLPEKLEYAKKNTLAKATKKWKPELDDKPIGTWTDDELWDYKLSHGHCVKSAY
jgi:3'-phosphoadenosine 5'-phosphosulfate sulfotransferase (PAPS reductase)/FAD synthetase